MAWNLSELLFALFLAAVAYRAAAVVSSRWEFCNTSTLMLLCQVLVLLVLS